jgi:hypothetical protein
LTTEVVDGMTVPPNFFCPSLSDFEKGCVDEGGIREAEEFWLDIYLV